MNTLLLTTDVWDLCLDAGGNIAMASNPYAIAQDAASAIRLFAGEQFYNTDAGVPYFTDILGQAPPLPLMKAEFVAAALTVPETVDAVCYVAGLAGRQLTGQVQVTDTSGAVSAAGF